MTTQTKLDSTATTCQLPAPGLGLDLAVAGLPVVVVTVEDQRILDVRVASREFLLAVTAGHHGGDPCKPNAGRFPWLLG